MFKTKIQKNYVLLQTSITSSVEANISDILKVDGGDRVSLPSLYHAASQAPVLSVRAELQDLVINAATHAAWI